ncbi:MAG: ribonuclease R [Longicatena sp.]
MNINEHILALVKEQTYKGLNATKLARELDLEDSTSFSKMMKELNELEANRILARDAKERYFLSEKLGYVTGTLRINPKGFGFVEVPDVSYYIGRDNLGLGMERDSVYARTWTNNDGSVEGEVIEVIVHNVKNVVGVVKIKDGSKYFLPDTSMNNRRFKITNYDDFHLVNDSKVLLSIDGYGQTLKCHIEKEIGYKYDPGIDILSILLEKNINPEFSEAVLKEVNKIPETLQDEEKVKRSDLTNLLTITIDGEDAKDLDDAISIEKIENGYRLYVHIADVSHYVREGSAIDKEAYARGTSVYVVDRVVPMLPHALCNGICSLNPRVERLTLTCMMDIDKKGNYMSYKVFPSIIKSHDRMTYTKVNEILAGNMKAQSEYPHLGAMCIDMKVLSNIIRRRREKLGSIDFDTKEAKIIVDDNGKPTDIVLRERGEAERIIEDFMIAANECVATYTKWLEVPSMYRIHETPEPKKMKELARIVKSLGYNFQGNIQNVYPKQLQELLRSAKGQDNYDVLSSFMLRSMQKARYDNRCIGHFGLALKEYLHFTSPIRRYPDLAVHRMLRKHVFEASENIKKMENDEKWCEIAAQQSSDRERNAVDAERIVDDMKKCEYMEAYVGHIFDGVVSGITKFGMFIELENTIEGLVHVSTLEDDYYHYDDMSKSLIGEHSANVYKMGQKVRVKCVGANRFKREIDFEVLAKKSKGKKRIKKG